ncbi:MAG: helix-hairpin-helix domain-containing protein, partial [Chloroflexota bacterium]
MPRRVARTDPPPAENPAIDPDGADPIRDLTNGDLARIFHDLGDMLEVQGELVFKTVAYHRAADAIGRSPVDLVSAYRAGSPPAIPGVGKAISDKIMELATTGRMAYYDRLAAEVPAGLVELLRIPGLGPKTVRTLYGELGIETIDDLRQAAEAGALRSVKGLSAKTEQLVLEGIERLETRPQRMLLYQARDRIDGIIDALAATPGVRSLEPAGSFRRRKETIGDLDLLAETDDGPGLIERFTSLGVVDHVVNRGGHKA